MRKFLYAVTIATLFATSVITIPASSAADKGYRYWGYYQSAPPAFAKVFQPANV